MQDSFAALRRYAGYTDLEALIAFSAKPLRKSLRVNTLKTTIDAVLSWGQRKNWTMTPVPWCPEAFFVDREDRSDALGRDLLHLVGHIYMQEAASMLPPAVLDPQPGEAVLDMSAAPGSKTTQMSAMMRNTGVIVGNDVQERRLWTLITALQRSGTVNTLVVKKVGQWYAKHMTERFDRVLVDAPCTAQGTVRKDSDALTYCGPENIAKMARLQEQLLESGIHAAKVGGYITYSTCTLTPEENEGVVHAIMNKFGDQIEVLPTGLNDNSGWIQKAQEDSAIVQRSLGVPVLPMLRMWPHVHDIEGFFCALIRKVRPTRAPEQFDVMPLPGDPMPKGRVTEISTMMQQQYGVSMLEADEMLYQREDQVLVAKQSVAELLCTARGMTIGLPYCKRLKDGRIRIAHELATLRGTQATTGTVVLHSQQLTDLLAGRDTTCAPDLRGDMLLLYEGLCIGRGLAKEGILKNALPRDIVRVDATVAPE